jgi:outer membrane lipoprotein-sorting protein
MKKLLFLILSSVICHLSTFSQDATALVKKVKAKLDKVNDYVAEGRMKTDVAFIKAPSGKVKVYFKKPNKFKLKRDGGISILPKGGVSVNMSSLLTANNSVAIASGESMLGGTQVKVVKLLPGDENSDVVLTTLYIDEANLLIRKANTTTRENGTYEMEMAYGKYADYALPDKVIFAFNTKDYKIPKGVTLEFETGEGNKQNLKNKKGRVEISYSSYIINKGVSDAEFK